MLCPIAKLQRRRVIGTVEDDIAGEEEEEEEPFGRDPLIG